ncbi:energy-coupling factor transporter transmembrane component T family protein [Furfurilactobacillus milii]|uniref:Energy-coupling factor transporter transmembrane protein EcfT n=1 Tax=Furfurilactobacillus milii TaxID=2888272 RepID=A0A6N9I2L6_9LACO|nr:energy-coupling factor transporter transmembrane component T [Furfurilactobacillus milii]MYV17382.1 energy-coupling factor transporter transmembrane protein EcfT [Furfurilactobacillus milii]
MNSQLLIGYTARDTFLNRLSGSTKLIGFVALSIIGMVTYDTRFLLGVLLISLILFHFSKIKYHEVAFVLQVIVAFAILNLVMVYVFAPSYGITIYGTHHMILGSPDHYFNLSWEQLFYEFNLLLKYIFAVPLALIFLMTTNPSEFAASLNKIGVSYRISYSVAIALRYIPDVQNDYRTISLAQQARGYEISRKAKLMTRAKGAVQIIMPLILSSLDRIEIISQAMELRRFGHNKKRTWYMAQPFKRNDYLALIIIVLIVLIGIALFKVNGGRFWNPFK